MSTRGGIAILVLLAASGCSGSDRAEPDSSGRQSASASTGAVAVLDAVFETQRDTLDNIDSPAVWHGPAGEHWLLATAKETDVVLVVDAVTGEILRRVGGQGSALGKMNRPNGIAVIDDLLWVVERDNARVQIFELPSFGPIGVFGENDLQYPYGISLVARGNDEYLAYVTDNYEYAEDVIPADSLLGERVRRYRVSLAENRLNPTLESTFGDTSGAGRLRVVESLAADPESNLLLIAEEEEGASMIKVYDLSGAFTGRVVDSTFFPNQAEGIVLYSCPAGEGYWIATDQGVTLNTFHVFERKTLDHLGSFRGRTVLNTDGIALTQASFGPFESGAFFAVHDDGGLAAFHWSEIATALGLRADCTH